MLLVHRFLLFCFVLATSCSAIFAQVSPDLWKGVEQVPDIPGERWIQPDEFQLFVVDFENLKLELRKAPLETFERKDAGLAVALPMPDGRLQTFEVFMTWVLAEEDGAKYPDIRTFVGRGKDDPYAYVRMDFTPHGFHAMILTKGNSYWVDPYAQGNTAYYVSYRKSDVNPRADEEYVCHAIDLGLDLSGLKSDLQRQVGLPTGPQLRVYDLAVTCVGEYGAFHGGTKTLAQAAIVTSINRVSGLFERDMTIRLVLVPNNDTLVFADPATDPFPCCNLGTTLGIGANLIDSLIGFANYDIGHSYCTYGGGGAANGVCESDKARGATGLTNPVGDPFDVDYVAHEIGHQFYAGHTFNYCPGQGGVPHEPGSGSTILAYAGLCGTANMQNNSVDAFSVGSYQQSVTYTQTGFGASCATLINTNNQTPSVTVPAGGFYIPRSTPFELDAIGSDGDGDSLTYSWEQWDFGPNVHPDSAAGDCPLFRVLWPTNDSHRIFPQISDIVQGTQTIGEQLPSYGRTMTFRCAIRDNHGGADFSEMQFFVADSAGPFVLTYPNTAVGFWTVGSVQNISWNVAQTDFFPVNCQKVDLYLSTDGGYTYPILLAAGRPNNGATAITVPNHTGSNMRVKIKGAGNHFFDISDSDFAILPTSTPDYSLTVAEPFAFLCGQDTATYLIELDTLGLFTDAINLSLNGLPTGAGFALSQTQAVAPDSVLLRVWNGTAAAGDYSLNLQANSSSGIKQMPLSLGLRNGPPAGVSLISPFNGAISVPNSPVLNWNAIPFANSYRIQLSLSPAFDSLLLDEGGLNTSSYPLGISLDNNAIYYWRVQVDSFVCGAGPWGAVYSFQTPLINCTTYTSSQVPVAISPNEVDTVYSTLTVPNSLLITDLNVLDVQGDHTWMDDLGFFLISPQQTRLHLFGYQCGDQDDFWFSFDDSSSTATVPCPPTTGLVYQPITALSNVNSENALGDWTLEIIDRFAADGGQLTNWSLEICGPTANTGPPSLQSQQLTVVQGDSATITPLYLQATCQDSSSDATFTLISLPQYGTLLLQAQPLVVGDTFTQAAVNAGWLTYVHDSVSAGPDQFQFSLSCDNGGYVGGLSFPIEIQLLPPLSLLAREDVRLLVYPNPAQDAFQLQVQGIAAGQLELSLFDLMGRQVLAQEAFGNEMSVSLQGISRGWYMVYVRRRGELLGAAKLVRE